MPTRAVDRLGRVAPEPERALRADRAAPLAGLHAPEVAVVRERAELTAGRPAEHGDKRRLRERSKLADRPHVPRVEAPRRRGADAPDALDRQRVEKREFAIGRDGDQPVGLRDAARHLREELRPRHPDRDGQADPLAHRSAQAHRDLDRRPGDALHPAHIEERLVDRQPLDDGRGVLEHGEHRAARLRVRLVARPDDDRVGAEPSRLPPAHRRPDAVRLRFVARREHDAAADDDRPASQPRVVPLLDRGEERVSVGMQHEHVFVLYLRAHAPAARRFERGRDLADRARRLRARARARRERRTFHKGRPGDPNGDPRAASTGSTPPRTTWRRTTKRYSARPSPRSTATFLVATKVAPGAAITGGGSGFRREQVHAACRGSLERLGRDHIDLYFLHWPDEQASRSRRRGARWPSAPTRARAGDRDVELRARRCRAMSRATPGRCGSGRTEPHRLPRRQGGDRRLGGDGIAVTIYEPLGGGILTGKTIEQARAAWREYGWSPPSTSACSAPVQGERSFAVADGLRPDCRAARRDGGASRDRVGAAPAGRRGGDHRQSSDRHTCARTRAPPTSTLPDDVSGRARGA